MNPLFSIHSVLREGLFTFWRGKYFCSKQALLLMALSFLGVVGGVYAVGIFGYPAYIPVVAAVYLPVMLFYVWAVRQSAIGAPQGWGFAVSFLQTLLFVALYIGLFVGLRLGFEAVLGHLDLAGVTSDGGKYAVNVLIVLVAVLLMPLAALPFEMGKLRAARGEGFCIVRGLRATKPAAGRIYGLLLGITFIGGFIRILGINVLTAAVYFARGMQDSPFVYLLALVLIIPILIEFWVATLRAVATNRAYEAVMVHIGTFESDDVCDSAPPQQKAAALEAQSAENKAKAEADVKLEVKKVETKKTAAKPKAKKAAPKKATSKKPAAKKTSAKKPAAKKTTTKKSTAKKAPAKKTTKKS